MRREAVGVLVLGALSVGLLGGCTSESGQVRRLRSAVPQERFQAVLWLARHGSRDAVDPLIGSLQDEDPSVRWAAVHALRELTDQAFGYRPEAPEPRRREAIGRWSRWWAQNQGTSAERVGGPGGQAQPPPPPTTQEAAPTAAEGEPGRE